MQDKQPMRPAFMDALSYAYRYRRQNVFVLTGRVHDLLWSPKDTRFAPLEQLLCRELADEFIVMRMNMATELRFSSDADKARVAQILSRQPGQQASGTADLERLIQQSAESPLSMLTLVKGIADEVIRLQEGKPGTGKPLCTVIQYAGSMFPDGDFNRLSELDRQRLVFLMNWVNTPAFIESPHMLVLISQARSEVNGKITALPNATHIEIRLPDAEERTWFTQRFMEESQSGRHKIRFEGGRMRFYQNTAGLALSDIKMMLEAAGRTGKTVKRSDVVALVDEKLQAELGDIVRFKKPTHTPADIIGHPHAREIFTRIFQRCENPDTAVSVLLVSGPNGGGKTFQLEAYAAQSGRVVIELAGIRGQYFGQTDRFFELLRWHIRTFGKLLILVDEAHTAFGSVHAQDVHPTERRLAGNIIKMMGDPSFLGKVLWGLMTSRPDQIDPDVKSRAPVQIPIFDLEGEERSVFVAEMFQHKGITLGSDELDTVLSQTSYYSARDYRNLVAEVLAHRQEHPATQVAEVLKFWQVSRSIEQQRLFQSLIAAQHCSYPQLLPEALRSMGIDEIRSQIEKLRWAVQR